MKTGILDMCHHSYIVFGRGSAVKAVMFESRYPVTSVARKAKGYKPANTGACWLQTELNVL